MTRVILTCAVSGLLAVACSSRHADSPTSPEPVPGTTPVRVLMLTATAGFRHESIATAREVMGGLAASTGAFTIAMTEDLEAVGATSLAGYDAVFFALTSGELALRDDQKRALLDFVARGGGFLGVHSATDTLYGWPEYGALLGAWFKEHPWTEQATIVVEDRAHPSTDALGGTFSLLDEFYTFRENPRSRVHVLLSLDAASVGATGDYPLAWTRTSGSGRVYYNALGHFPSTWQDARFQQQIVGAIRWAAKYGPAGHADSHPPHGG